MINLNKVYELYEQDPKVCVDYIWLEINSMMNAHFYHHIGNALRSIDYNKVNGIVILAMLAACWRDKDKVDDWDYALAKYNKTYPV